MCRNDSVIKDVHVYLIGSHQSLLHYLIMCHACTQNCDQNFVWTCVKMFIVCNKVDLTSWNYRTFILKFWQMHKKRKADEIRRHSEIIHF